MLKTQIDGKIPSITYINIFDRNPSRLVILSSESHRQPKMNSINLAQLSCTKENYFSVLQYNRSKFCNVLHMHHLACKLANRHVIVHSVHPGNMVQTGIQRRWWGWKLLFALASPFTKSVTQGKIVKYQFLLFRKVPLLSFMPFVIPWRPSLPVFTGTIALHASQFLLQSMRTILCNLNCFPKNFALNLSHKYKLIFFQSKCTNRTV